MQCYTELTPPTAVTHSLSLPFLSSSANNLIVAKTSLLQIFSFKSIVSNTNTDHNHNAAQNTNQSSRSGNSLLPSEVGPSRGERVNTTKLVLVAEYNLSGTITSIGRVKILKSKSGGEVVLVALRDAKLSLIEWDPERHSISTISIHYYEREDLQGSPWEPDLSQCVSQLCVDPRSRCALLKFGARHLAILPFYQAGDELVMDDFEPEIDESRPASTEAIPKASVANSVTEKTPYAASFVLSLLALDPTLSYPVHLAFLYEYREPTFGIISSQTAVSTAMLSERRDTVSYSVFSLDLEQRASTTLLSVNNLPYDLFAVKPLPLPVGGALLIGGNELIHVDQAGKAVGVAVNGFAKKSTSFALLDQSELGLRLEYCVIDQLGTENSELLMILSTGDLAIITFKTDGRSVSGLSVRRLPEANGGLGIHAAASCTSLIGRGRMFVGSETASSVIIGWSRRSDKPKRQRLRDKSNVGEDEEVLGLEEDEEDEEDDDDDDLYSGANLENEASTQGILSSSVNSNEEYIFRIHDSMQNAGPMKDVAFRNDIDSSLRAAKTSEVFPSLEVAVSTGSGRVGGLTLFQRKLTPKIIDQFNILSVESVWTVCAQRISGNSSTHAAKIEGGLAQEHDKYVIASSLTKTGEERSNAYSVKSTGLEEIKGTDFDPTAGATVEVGTLNSGARIVQVLPSELRTFDGDFGLAQIFPMTDDVTGAEPKVFSATFADPYVLLVRDDMRIVVLKADESGDLDEIEQETASRERKWLSGSLYEDSNDVLRLESDDDNEDEAGNVLMFLLNIQGGLEVYRLPNLNKPVYVANGLSFLPPFLSTEFTLRRSSGRDEIKEILVAELGDSSFKSPYLILRSIIDDLIIYQPYQSPIEGSRETALRFLKISVSTLPIEIETRDEDEERKTQPLRVINNLGNFSAVFVPGVSPSFIIKPASSLPQVIGLKSGAIRSLSGFNTFTCERGFVYIDSEGSVLTAKLPSENQYSTGWVTQTIVLGDTIEALDYHDEQNSYVIGTSRKCDFKMPDTDILYDFGNEDISFPPQIDRGTIKLLDRGTWSIIDQHELDSTEVVMCIKTMSSLETSENTPSRKTLIAVGTAFIRGEDLASAGRIYIWDIIDVVPEPGRPETNRKFKLMAKEDVKGAVTALSELGTQGFLIAAQGQKCMVRGLKEDGTLLPVAFMDMQCYVTAIKEMPGTGLCLMADAVKGLWLTGYYEEPYQLRLFSKSPHAIEVLAADFLPDGKQLFLVAADADGNIHVLQFDPEDPKSLSGQRLLPITTFHTSHYPTTLTLLPLPSPTPLPHPTPHHHNILLTSTTGSLSLLTPLPPSTHRTLSALQSHLQNTLSHPLSLNPRAYRAGGGNSATGGAAGSSGISGGAGGGGGREVAGGVGGAGGKGGIIDGMMVRRWMEPGTWKRWEGGIMGGGMGGMGGDGGRGGGGGGGVRELAGGFGWGFGFGG